MNPNVCYLLGRLWALAEKARPSKAHHYAYLANRPQLLLAEIGCDLRRDSTSFRRAQDIFREMPAEPLPAIATPIHSGSMLMGYYHESAAQNGDRQTTCS